MKSLIGFSIGIFCSLLATSPVWAEAPKEEVAPQPDREVENLDVFAIFPSDIDLNKPNQKPSRLVARLENALQHERADQWALSLDAEVEPLTFETIATDEALMKFYSPIAVNAGAEQDALFSSIVSNPEGDLSKLTLPGDTKPTLISSDRLLPQSADARGNVNYRWNAEQDLTFNIGTVYDRSILRSGELSYQPKNFPLQFRATAKTGTNEVQDYNLNLNLQASSAFGVNFSGNHNASQIKLNWQLLPGVTFTGSRNNRDESLGAEMRIAHKLGTSSSINTTAGIDTNNNLRWSLNSGFGRLQLSHRGNQLDDDSKDRFSTNSELSFALSDPKHAKLAHLLRVNYETNDVGDNNQELTTVSWGFRTNSNSEEKKNPWEFNVGYGVGTQGEGFSGSIAAPVTQGLMLRARYQDVTLTSDEPSFKLELFSPRR
jgi:hypothetical protein